MPNAASAGRSASGQRWIHPERNTLAMPICLFCFQAWRTQKAIRRLCMRCKVRRFQTPERRSFRHGKCRSWRKTAELISSPDLGNTCWDSCRIRGRQHSGRDAVSVLPKKNTANFTIVLMEQVFVLHGLPARSFSFRESCLACVRWRMDGKHLHVSHLRISATSAARFQHRMD